MKLSKKCTFLSMLFAFSTTIFPINEVEVKKWAQRERIFRSSPEYLRYPDKLIAADALLKTTVPSNDDKAQWKTITDDIAKTEKFITALKKQGDRKIGFMRELSATVPFEHIDFFQKVIRPIYTKIDPTKDQNFESLLKKEYKKLTSEYKTQTKSFENAIKSAFKIEKADLPLEQYRKSFLTKVPVRIKGSIEGILTSDIEVEPIDIPLVSYELFLSEIQYLRSLTTKLRNTGKLDPITATKIEDSFIAFEYDVYLDRLIDAESLIALAREIIRDSTRYLMEKYSQEAKLVRKMGSFTIKPWKKIQITATQEQRNELRDMMLTSEDLQKVYQRFLEAIKLTQIARAQRPELDYSYFFNAFLPQDSKWKLWLKQKFGYDFPILKAKLVGVHTQAMELSILTSHLGHSMVNLFNQITRYVIDRKDYLPQQFAQNISMTLKGIAPSMISAISTYLEDYKFWIEYLSVVTHSKTLNVKDITKRLDKINARIQKVRIR